MDSLEIIKNWEFKNWPDDFYKFAEFIKNCWREDYGYYRLWGRKLWLSTGGWSENESIMSAIDQNKTFNMVCWEEIRRGGHYKFELPKKKATKKSLSK
jgi:hypothetical protein